VRHLDRFGEGRVRPGLLSGRGGVVRAKISFDEAEDGSKDVEICVLWETSGKGDTDHGILHFERVRNVCGERVVEAQLPLLPTTYDGGVVKVGWFFRARTGDFGPSHRAWLWPPLATSGHPMKRFDRPKLPIYGKKERACK
jgi:hypothetical protein